MLGDGGKPGAVVDTGFQPHVTFMGRADAYREEDALVPRLVMQRDNDDQDDATMMEQSQGDSQQAMDLLSQHVWLNRVECGIYSRS